MNEEGSHFFAENVKMSQFMRNATDPSFRSHMFGCGEQKMCNSRLCGLCRPRSHTFASKTFLLAFGYGWGRLYDGGLSSSCHINENNHEGKTN